jgi:raffinose/stachyose/melibiose transport system permease protein
MADYIRANLYRAMVLPAILLFCTFFLYPLARGIGLSLTDWNGYSKASFIGFKNFIRFFSDSRAVGAWKNTLVFGFFTPILMNILGFAYALLLDRKIAGRNIARVIVYLPAIISPLIIGYIWVIVLRREGGALHDLMRFVGAGAYFRQWLSVPSAAMLTVILINAWQRIGSVMIIYLAGMQSIPQELYEVSTIDGANYFQDTFHITLPLLISAIKINVITNIINSLAIMDSIVALTDGGPGYYTETMSLFIYRMTYGNNTGYATAVALILFVTIMVPTIPAYRWLTTRDVEM